MTLSGHACPVWCLKASDADMESAHEYTIVSGGDDGRTKLWDLRAAFGGSRLTLSGTRIVCFWYRYCVWGDGRMVCVYVCVIVWV